MKVLESLWHTKPETASRLRGRIEAVLDWATVRGYRKGENPARWRGHLDKLLPARSKVRSVQHHAALPYADIGGFFQKLHAVEGAAARAVEFAILNAARTAEVLGATWPEIDLPGRLWTIPAHRMKGDREHRVPLSPAAMALLEATDPPERHGFLFPGERTGARPSENAMWNVLRRIQPGITVHGFRSTFRDWAAETTAFPSDVVEMALAHAIAGKVEAAYRRGDLLDKRRRLMEAWAEFCAKASTTGEVVPLRNPASA
jgi:integrase